MAYLTISLIVGWVVYHIPSRVTGESTVSVCWRLCAVDPGAGAWHRQSGERLAALDQSGGAEFAAIELMKLAVVMYAANYTVRKAEWMHSVRKGFMPMAIAVIATGALLLLEPDFGAFTVIASIAMGTLFLGGINGRILPRCWWSVWGFCGADHQLALPLATGDRFYGPVARPVRQGLSVVALADCLGRGEWLGVGLGGSVENCSTCQRRILTLMAVIAEECGFIGIAVVIALFATVVRRAFVITAQARDQERYFQALVAQGMGIWLGVQSFINIGVNMGLLPTRA